MRFERLKQQRDIIPCENSLLGLRISVAACTTLQFTPTAAQPQTGGLRLLYEYPQDGKFKSLGTINAYKYKSGLHAPLPADVLPS